MISVLGVQRIQLTRASVKLEFFIGPLLAETPVIGLASCPGFGVACDEPEEEGR